MKGKKAEPLPEVEIPDVGKLPEGWLYANLGSVANYINGMAFKPTDWEEKGRPIIRIQNLTKSTNIVNYCSREVDKKLAL